MVGWSFRRRPAGDADVSVEEGPLIAVPTPDATGMDRRALGEFVGPRGELASYAFGWTTDADPHVARISIGIGAGNPGGGTFHARIFTTEEGHAFGLVDEHFEEVDQGGPDLTADEARAHEDLPFIWAVADQVMERDRRAWWMRHWLWGTSAAVTPQVFDLAEPVLLVANDDFDDLWQLIGAGDGVGSDGKIAHLHHFVDEDPTLIEVLDLDPGEHAIRERSVGRGPGAPTRRARAGDTVVLHRDGTLQRRAIRTALRERAPSRRTCSAMRRSKSAMRSSGSL